jgi:hypothetical protein
VVYESVAQSLKVEEPAVSDDVCHDSDGKDP